MSTDPWRIEICKPNSTVTTELAPSSITVDESVIDTVAVSGLEGVYAASGGPYPMPTGNVQFQYKAPGDTEWNDLGGPVELDEYGWADSVSISPSIVGDWLFQAIDEGDENYNGNDSGDEVLPVI